MKPLLQRIVRTTWKLALFVGLFCVAAMAGTLGYFEFRPPAKACVTCHEIREPAARWASSTHRNVDCKACHGGTLGAAKENFTRLVGHLRDKNHDKMALNEDQVIAMNEVCGKCHTQEYAQWQASGHGVGYAAIFLNEKHNHTEQAAGDCLRCHGMFFRGNVADVVEPIDTKGPWHLKNAAFANRPVIPCLACHSVHHPGEPAGMTAQGGSAKASRSRCDSQTPMPALTDSERLDQAAKNPALQSASEPASGMNQPITISAISSADLASAGHNSLYCRREGKHIAAADLPVPVIQDQGRPVQVSSDARQRLCVQCHAPNAFGQAGSSDDRTPRGVHEGLSCAACHQGHANDARASCVQCHPRLSNCGLDVATMDTTFKSLQSGHNIHSVSCADCHTSGVPERKKRG